MFQLKDHVFWKPLIIKKIFSLYTEKNVLCWNLHFHKIKFWFEFYIYKFISYLIHFSLFYFQRVEINMLNVCWPDRGAHPPPSLPWNPISTVKFWKTIMNRGRNQYIYIDPLYIFKKQTLHFFRILYKRKCKLILFYIKVNTLHT